MLTLFPKGVYLIDQLGPTYKQLQTGVREKEKEETKAKAILRVDDKKELSNPPRRKEKTFKELKRFSL